MLEWLDLLNLIPTNNKPERIPNMDANNIHDKPENKHSLPKILHVFIIDLF